MEDDGGSGEPLCTQTKEQGCGGREERDPKPGKWWGVCSLKQQQGQGQTHPVSKQSLQLEKESLAWKHRGAFSPPASGAWSPAPESMLGSQQEPALPTS